MKFRQGRSALLKSLCLIIISALMCIVCARTSPAYQEKDVVGIWTFDEGKGETFKDSSANKHDGTIFGNVEWVEGKFGTALGFPGNANSIATVEHTEDHTLKTFSITIWIKTTVRNCKTLITKEEPNGVGNFMMFVAANGSVIFEFWSGGAWFGSTGATAVDDDEWHHVAGTYDKKALKVYIDGVLESDVPASSEPDEIATPLRFGVRHGGQCILTGALDDAGLFNVALSIDDINSIMEDGLATAQTVSPSSKMAYAWGGIKAHY